jgi:hypothetical protein
MGAPACEAVGVWSPRDALRARLSPPDADEAWRAVVASCLVAGEMRRLRFDDNVLAHPRYDAGVDRLVQERGELELGGLATVGAQVLGRALVDGRWRWAFDDDALHPNVRADSRSLRTYARRNGLGARLTDGTVGGVALVDAALVGTMFVGADGYHVLPQEDGSSLVVLVRHSHLARQPLPYDRLPSVVGRLLSTYAVSHDMVLYGWRLYEDGLRFEERRDGSVVVEVTSLEGFKVGRRWVVERDADGTIVRVGDEAADGAAARAIPLRVLSAPGRPDLTAADPADAWRFVVSRSALPAAMRQARFEDRVLEHPGRPPGDPWNVDVHDRTLVIEGAGSFEIQALGTVEEDGTWLWGWADTSLPQALTWASADLRDSIAESQLPAALMAPRSSVVGLREAALVGLWHLDADGFYVAGRRDGGALVFVLWHEDLAAEDLPYERLPVVVPGLIVDLSLDHREVIAGWKDSRPPGLRLLDEPDGGVSAIVQDPSPAAGARGAPVQGHGYRIRLDDLGRISRVEATVSAREEPPRS